MVSWIRMFSDSSGQPGYVSGYGRIVTQNPTLPRRALWSFLTGAVLSSPGTVDTNTPQRAQYATAMGLPIYVANAAFRIDAGDVAAYPGGANFTGTMFIAPASAFAAGVTPTPDQIRLAATRVFRGTGQGGSPSSRTTAGDLNYLDMRSPVFTAEEPNKKFWIMVCPTAVASMISSPSIANDIPLGNVNVNGRAVSVWTNRTPLAPVITSPAGRTTTFAGAEVDLVFSPRDPDRITSFPGDSGRNDFDDVAGVQVQYAPRSVTDPNDPLWIDLPIANTTGTAFGPGWYIQDAVSALATDGAKQFWHSYRLPIRCGDVVDLAPNAAYLPSGEWQIRVRTFDYGHGWSDSDHITVSPPGTPGVLPLGYTVADYTPDTYPAVNTSPWSTPAIISVTAQVPKPIAVSPVNNSAVIEGSPVTLVWQYRNTYSPPYPQAKRTIQIRAVGEETWTTLVLDQVSASASYTVSGYDLVSGNHYEWRVQVTDASPRTSEFSDPDTFWVVPAPASGDIIPTPGDTLDGASLGCGLHRAFIYRRGGTERVGEVTGIISLEWNRVRDDISDAKVVVSGWNIDCGNLLAKLQTWAYELVLFRDNGFGIDRVWEGPLTLLTYESDKVTLHAKDMMGYAYRRIIRQQMDDTGDSPTAGATVTNRAMRILLNAFAPDDPNVLAYLQVLEQDDDARQYRSIPPYSRTAFEEVDDMAANAGLDYTCVGRAILLWGTKHRIGTLPEFRDKDLGNSPIVSEYGMSMSNGYVVSDGNGVYGEADRLNEDGVDPIYGLVEMLSSTWASDSTEDSGTYTQEGVATVKASFAASAERSISSRYPAPVVVRVPDNTRLNPDTVLSIQHLVPGVVVPLRSTSTLRTVVATQKLDSVKVVEEKGDETITITLSPFSRDDNATEGVEEG